MIDMRQRRQLIAVAAAGVAMFLAGLFMAKQRLPEWRAGRIPDHSYFATRLEQAAGRAGMSISGSPRFQLTSRSFFEDDTELDETDPTYRVMGTNAADWFTTRGRGPLVEAEGNAQLSSAEKGQLSILYSLIGEPVSARWTPVNPFAGRKKRTTATGQVEALSAIFGASKHEEEVEVLGARIELRELPVAGEIESLSVNSVPGIDFSIARRVPGSVAAARKRFQAIDLSSIVTPRIPDFIIKLLITLGTGALFLMLLVRRRIDFTNAAILTIASLAFTVIPQLLRIGSWYQLAKNSGDSIAAAIPLFILWSSTESWIRSTRSDYRTTLDTLRTGRIGPKNGMALLGGWAAGAAIAGLWLMAITASTMFAGVSPTDGSVRLPIYRPDASPLGQGTIQAGLMLLAIGAGLQLPLLRRIPFCGTFIGALFLATRLPVSRLWVALAPALLISAILAATYFRFELSALLTATIVSFALPAAVYSALHLSWLSGTFASMSLLTIAPILFGIVGLTRPEEERSDEIKAPAFVRRLEEERRVQYEMDLLARMQLGLLPQSTPQIEGYDIAARSILATEAGGDLYDFVTDDRDQLWIAAGDVSGHGYSCAIAQAMTKAGLASLIGSDQTPAAVLARLDRVLRTSGSSRTFTSLALLRLDPASGDGFIANAGHPYPLLATDGDIREIQISALPLGQGPARTYEDRPIRIKTGDVMAFCSDGLFEALNGNGAPYGYERLREVLRASRHLPAGEILDRIVTDWMKHLGRATAVDDTTVVVLKRNNANTALL